MMQFGPTPPEYGLCVLNLRQASWPLDQNGCAESSRIILSLDLVCALDVGGEISHSEVTLGYQRVTATRNCETRSSAILSGGELSFPQCDPIASLGAAFGFGGRKTSRWGGTFATFSCRQCSLGLSLGLLRPAPPSKVPLDWANSHF